jgi:hypothetical protein
MGPDQNQNKRLIEVGTVSWRSERCHGGAATQTVTNGVQVVDGVMEVGGTMGSLVGRVSRNGSVRATGYMGANYGVASERVSGNFGSGTWRAHTESGNCVGVWNAQRR